MYMECFTKQQNALEKCVFLWTYIYIYIHTMYFSDFIGKFIKYLFTKPLTLLDLRLLGKYFHEC